jgi:tRNA (mo5U34)-methyltransferase
VDPVEAIATGTDDDVRALVDAREWYHTIELRPGVTTPGWFDLRSVVARLPIPETLAGKRALDVGTFEGFWAYQLEARGADVVAIDILDPAQWDWPAGSDAAVRDAIGARKARGEGFELVHAALGSSVVRHELSVYDLDPDRLGRFDFVYVGSLLLHLRDPVRALERVRNVLTPDGRLLLVDAIDRGLARDRRPLASLDGRGRPWWWKPNPAGLARMAEAAGFELVEGPTQVHLPIGRGQRVPAVPFWRLGTAPGREQWVTRRRGDPHAYLLASDRLR